MIHVCSAYDAWLYCTCFLAVLHTMPGCTAHAAWLYCMCCLAVLPMMPGCNAYAARLYCICCLTVLRTMPGCTAHDAWLYYRYTCCLTVLRVPPLPQRPHREHDHHRYSHGQQQRCSHKPADLHPEVQPVRLCSSQCKHLPPSILLPVACLTFGLSAVTASLLQPAVVTSCPLQSTHLLLPATACPLP